MSLLHATEIVYLKIYKMASFVMCISQLQKKEHKKDKTKLKIKAHNGNQQNYVNTENSCKSERKTQTTQF